MINYMLAALLRRRKPKEEMQSKNFPPFFCLFPLLLSRLTPACEKISTGAQGSGTKTRLQGKKRRHDKWSFAEKAISEVSYKIGLSSPLLRLFDLPFEKSSLSSLVPGEHFKRVEPVANKSSSWGRRGALARRRRRRRRKGPRGI